MNYTSSKIAIVKDDDDSLIHVTADYSNVSFQCTCCHYHITVCINTHRYAKGWGHTILMAHVLVNFYLNKTITHWNQTNQTFIPLHETPKYVNFITELR